MLEEVQVAAVGSLSACYQDGAHGRGGTDPAHDGPGASDDVEGLGGGDDHTHEGHESDGSHTHDSSDEDSHEADGGGEETLLYTPTKYWWKQM